MTLQFREVKMWGTGDEGLGLTFAIILANDGRKYFASVNSKSAGGTVKIGFYDSLDEAKAACEEMLGTLTDD